MELFSKEKDRNVSIHKATAGYTFLSAGRRRTQSVLFWGARARARARARAIGGSNFFVTDPQFSPSSSSSVMSRLFSKTTHLQKLIFE